MNFIITLICFLFVLGITVLIHEFGHFIFAKKSGVYVYEFSIGMGPQIFKFKRKNDETEYSIRLLPIGGYVSMAGEVVEEEGSIPKEKQMTNKKWHQRFMILFAGILFNFILAITIFFIVGLINGKVSRETYISELQVNYPAIETNLKVNDEIVSLNGKKIFSSDILLLKMKIFEGKTIELGVKHENGESEVISITPVKEEIDGETSYHYGFGLKNNVNAGIKDSKNFVVTIVEAIEYSFTKFISLSLQMLLTVFYLIIGKLKLGALSGPIGIYNLVGSTRETGLLNLIFLTGFLSLNVGFVNFLPIPAMDGGRLLFLMIEKIIGHPVDSKVENTIHTVGLGLLMLLMVYVTIQDVIRLF